MKLDAKQGEQKLEQLARCSRRPPLGLGQPTPARCDRLRNARPTWKATEDPQGDQLEERSDGLAWAAVSFVETTLPIIGYDQLWMLRAHLDDHEPVAEMRKAG